MSEPSKPEEYKDAPYRLGGRLVSVEELEAAAQKDKYIQYLYEQIEKEKVKAIEAGRELSDAFAKMKGIRGKRNRIRARIEARKSQIKHCKKVLLRMMVYEKLKEAREKFKIENRL